MPTGWSTSASLLHSNYFWFGVLSQTTLGVAVQQQSSGAIHRLSHGNGPRRIAPRRRHDVDSKSLIRRRSGRPPTVSNLTVQLTNQLQWFSDDNKHTIKVTSSLSREHNTTDVGASLGTFSFNSLADLQAGNACRLHAHALVDSPAERSGDGGRVGRRRVASVEHRPGAVRRSRGRQPLSLPAGLQCRRARHVRHSQRRRAESHQLQSARRRAVDLRHGADDRVHAGRGAAAARGDSRGRRHLSECWNGEPDLERRGADRFAHVHAIDCVRRPRGAGPELELVRTGLEQRSERVRRQQHRQRLLDDHAECVRLRPAIRAAALLARPPATGRVPSSTIATCSASRACTPGT